MKRIAHLSSWVVVAALSVAWAWPLEAAPKRRGPDMKKLAEQIRAAAPDKPVAKPAKPRKVLVYSQCTGFYHRSIPVVAKAVEILGEKTGAFETVVSDDIAMFLPENIKQFDAIFLNNNTGELFEPHKKLPADQRKLAEEKKDVLRESLLSYVRNGGGIAGSHAATDSSYKWAEYGEMIGGYFWGHPWRAGDTVTIKIDRPNHPLTAAFAGKAFEVKEEIYQFKMEPYSRDKQLVLMSLDTDKTDMTKRGIRRKDGDFAISWVKPYGKGRVFYCSLGHNNHIMTTPAILHHYLAGIQFAVGDVTCRFDPSKPPKKGACVAETSDGSGDSGRRSWRLASQAWTFRKHTTFETLEMLQKLGVKYIEIYPRQRISEEINEVTRPGMSDKAVAALRKKLDETGIRFVAYGVTGLPDDEDRCRKVFEWAKEMGIETICSEPKMSSVPMIDKLAQEYGVNVAIHNHPKPSRYWNPDTVLEACKGRSERIGACADTGHWVRSGLDPVESLRKLEGRIIQLHFKDLNQRARKAHDVPWGTGAGDAAGQVAELARQNWSGLVSIEYETGNWQIDELAKCVQWFRTQQEKHSATPGRVASAGRGEWTWLFRGEDLSHFTQSGDGWVIEDGAIHRAKKAGFLWSKQSFDDFVLDLEFKVAKGTNSGVFLRTADRKQWLHTGIEVQILDSHGKKPTPHTCGAIYDCLAPSEEATKPAGEWNRMTVTAMGSRISVMLNGKRVIDMDLDEWTEPHQNPDGSKNKFKYAYKDMARSGYVGFQDHGKPVWYRNVRIKPLGETKTASAASDR